MASWSDKVVPYLYVFLQLIRMYKDSDVSKATSVAWSIALAVLALGVVFLLEAMKNNDAFAILSDAQDEFRATAGAISTKFSNNDDEE